MRIVFFGTPEFAAVSLRALLRERFDIAGVVTQPDRPQGRSRSTLLPPPVKVTAEQAGLAVLQPDRPIGDIFEAGLRRLEPDLGVVVAYGHILRPHVLAIPRRGMINVHASLLPALRGAAPIQTAILNGDTRTGISIMEMEAGLDSGPVLHMVETPIAPDETAGALSARLAELGAQALIDALVGMRNGTAKAVPQDDAGATFAPKIDRATARIHWDEPAAHVARRIRAMDPAPGAWALLGGGEVKLFGGRVGGWADGRTDPEVGGGSAAPGTVLEAGLRLVVATGEGAVSIGEVQPAGKRRFGVSEWVRGRGIAVGQRFE
jgi:methionyl-tRNA formyltransferase